MRTRAVVTAALAVLAVVGLASAAPGDLDPTFSGNGWVRTYDLTHYTISYQPKGAEDVAVQPDGKIVAVGEFQGGDSYSAFGAFRYTPAGDLDRSFGSAGWVATEVGHFEAAHAVALQRDGKIVLAGEGSSFTGTCELMTCFALVRYNGDGSLDRSFGSGGVVRTPFEQCGCFAFDVALQPDGKIVAVGRRFRYGDAQNDELFAVARYLPDGRLDRTFSHDGRASVDFGYGDDFAFAVAVQPNGKILVAGMGTRQKYRSGSDFAFARFRPNGTLDRTFAGYGRQTVGFRSRREDFAYALDLQPNGRIIAAGESGIGVRVEDARIALVRLLPNGRLDRSFGAGGRRLTKPVRNGGYAQAVLVQPDGRILTAGRAYDDADRVTSAWVLARFTPRGRLDHSFGRGGIVLSDFGTGADWGGALALQRDGKILAAGSVYEDQAVARYQR